MIEYEIETIENDSIQKNELCQIQTFAEKASLHREVNDKLSILDEKVDIIKLLIATPILYGLSFATFQLIFGHKALSFTISILVTLFTLFLFEVACIEFRENKIFKKMSNFFLGFFKKREKTLEKYQNLNNELIEMIQDPTVQRNLILDLKELDKQVQSLDPNDTYVNDSLMYIVKALAKKNYVNVKDYVVNYSGVWQTMADSIREQKLLDKQKQTYLKNIQVQLEDPQNQDEVSYNFKTIL